MAKISFHYRGKQDNGRLSVRLVNSKEFDYMVSSPIESKKEYWIKRTTSKGKTAYKHKKLKDLNFGSAEVKKHYQDLKDIQDAIIDQFIKDYNGGVAITKEWLKTCIDEHHKALTTKEEVQKVANEENSINNLNLLTTAIEKMLVKYKTNKNELRKYEVTLNRLKDFQDYSNNAYKIKDLNSDFADQFKNWAFLEMQYSKSYINSILKRLRASAVKAYENDETDTIEISKTLRTFEMFKEPYKDKVVVTLNYNELDKIDKTVITHERLQDAKKAILIGCETGLRYSDMNKLIDTNIKNIEGVNYWEFRTNKTDKLVQITITNRIINLIDQYGLPQTNYPDNGVQLNRDVQQVVKLSGIDEKIKAKKPASINVNGIKVKRSISDEYSKHELITTRTFRRSFATNYFGKIDTALITNITGHSTEQMLLAYINKKDTTNIIRTKNQIDQFHVERKIKKNDIKLTVIPKASNE